MKRIYLLLTAVMVTVCMSADSYRDKLAQYLQVGNIMDREQYANTIQTLAVSLIPDDPAKREKIVNEYIQTQYADDIVDLVLPAFRKNVTEEELNTLVQTFTSPQVLVIRNKSNAVLSTIKESKIYKEFIEQYQNAMMQILQGQKPQDVQLSTAIDQEYSQLFLTYYTQAKIGETTMSAFNSMTGMMRELLISNGIDKAAAEQIVAQLLRYTQRNIPKVLAEIYHDTLTKQDLQVLTQLAEMPESKHAMQAANEIVSSNPMQFGFDLIEKMVNWMDSKYPAEAKSIRNILQEANHTLGQ